MLFTMICTCPFLQESGEFSLSSLHPPIRQRTASCTWREGNVGREGGEGGEGAEKEGRVKREEEEEKDDAKERSFAGELFLK